MTPVVVDTNVVARLLVEYPDSERAERLLYSEDKRLLAPDLCMAELTNTAWKWVRCGWRTADEAALLLRAVARLPITFVSSEPLMPSALDLAVTLGHPAYDCFYLALALAEDTQLLTADERLAGVARAGGLGRYVTLLAEYEE